MKLTNFPAITKIWNNGNNCVKSLIAGLHGILVVIKLCSSWNISIDTPSMNNTLVLKGEVWNLVRKSEENS